MPQVEVRIWMDGAFDLMHYGHVNAFRQGRALGTHLVVGVNSDESITRCKGPPIMNDQERLAMIEAPLCYSHNASTCSDPLNRTIGLFVKRLRAPDIGEGGEPSKALFLYQGGPGEPSTALETALLTLHGYLNQRGGPLSPP